MTRRIPCVLTLCLCGFVLTNQLRSQTKANQVIDQMIDALGGAAFLDAPVVGSRPQAAAAGLVASLPARSGPLALSEYGHASAVSVEAVDIDLVGTDHPVDVDQALVAALRRDLFRR